MSPKQAFSMLLVLAGLVAGVTFAVHYRGTQPPNTTTAPPGGDKVAQVFFPSDKLSWEPAYLQDVAVGTASYRDFEFTSLSDFAAEIHLVEKSCKCGEIYGCAIPADLAQPYRIAKESTVAGQAALAPGGALPWLAMAAAYVHTANNPPGGTFWLPLTLDKRERLNIPPQCAGLIRVGWKPTEEQQQPTTLAVTLGVQAKEGGPITPARLEVPVYYVAPVRVTPDVRQLGDLGPNSKVPVDFVCYSPNLIHFQLTGVPDRRNDPCLTRAITPLTPAECRALSEANKTKVLSGYRVTVTLHERLSDTVQMDLGPFTRVLTFEHDQGGPNARPLQAGLAGVIRGAVAVGSVQDKDKINFGDFSAARGSRRQVRIVTEVPGVEVRLDEPKVEPEILSYMQVQLTRTKGSGSLGRWDLTVEIPPDSPPGLIPPGSAVILKTAGDNSRRIRVPLSGNATQ